MQYFLHRSGVLNSSAIVLASYPVELGIVNPDAETGDTTGWTEYYGSGFNVKTPLAYEGTYRFVHSTSAGSAAFGQVFDFPASAFADIDAGLCVFVSDLFAFSYTDTDSCTFNVDFLDGSDNIISHWNTTNFEPAESWEQLVHPIVIPSGARKVRWMSHGDRDNGSELSVYYDKFRPKIDLITNRYSAAAILGGFMEADAAEAATWTFDLGDMGYGAGDYWDRIYSLYGFNGGSNADTLSHKDYAIPASFLTNVAGGAAKVRLGCQITNSNLDDQINIEVVFLDGTDTETGTALGWVTVGTTANARPSGLAQMRPVVIEGTIPTDCETIRVRARHHRIDGTVSDASFYLLRVEVYDPL